MVFKISRDTVNLGPERTLLILQFNFDKAGQKKKSIVRELLFVVHILFRDLDNI